MLLIPPENEADIAEDIKVKTRTQGEFPDALPLTVAAGKLIRELRYAQKLSGADIGELLGISQQAVSRYERGICDLTLGLTESFANALGLTLWQFMDELFLYIKMSDIRTTDNRNTLPYLNYPDDILAVTIAAEASGAVRFFNQNQ